MKTTILLAVFLAGILTTNAQDKEHYVFASVGVDVTNAIVGSEPTKDKSALDYILQTGIVFKSNVELTATYEKFKVIGFEKYAVSVGYGVPLYAYPWGKEIRTIFVSSIEPTLINRHSSEWQKSTTYGSIAINLGLRWHINKSFAAEYQMNALPRSDLYDRYSDMHDRMPIIYSSYVKLTYKINFNRK